MKIIMEVLDRPARLAERCHQSGGKCPVGITTSIVCPFDKLCDEITPEDWKKLEVENEDV